MESDRDDSVGFLGVAIVVVIVVIIVIVLIAYAFRGSNIILPIYTFTGSGSSAMETYTADNYTVFSASAPSSGMTLAITAPTDATGKQFIIDNSTGTGTVTLTGVTVQGSDPSSNKVLTKRVGTFLWKSQTTVVRLS